MVEMLQRISVSASEIIFMKIRSIWLCERKENNRNLKKNLAAWPIFSPHKLSLPHEFQTFFYMVLFAVSLTSWQGFEFHWANSEFMFMAPRMTSLFSFSYFGSENKPSKSSMHGYFWDLETFEVFVTSDLWSFTEYLLCSHRYALGRYVLCICVNACVHAGLICWMVKKKTWDVVPFPLGYHRILLGKQSHHS